MGLLRVLCCNMIIKRLLSRRLIITMAALVLEGSSMLRLDVHVDRGLVLLNEGTMGALKLAGCRAQILEGHFGDSLCCGITASIFCSPLA